MLDRLFRRREGPGGQDTKRQSISRRKVPRHSSGWAKTLERLKSQEGLRVLDIGPTSPTNINFLTSLGHSVFMSDLVEESNRPEWVKKSTDGDPDTYDTGAFIGKHMDFGQRIFDVVLLWDALDYIPVPMAGGIVHRLHECMKEGGEILGLFHARATGQETLFCRYHLTDGDNVEMQEHATHPLVRVYPNRAIENLFAEFRACRFFLAKDNLCEVIVTR